MENNNNMTPEEKFNKLLEEMKKLGNIRLSEEFLNSESKKMPENADDFIDMMSKFGKDRFREAGEFVKKMKEAASSTGAETVKGECTKQAEQPKSEAKTEQKEPEKKNSLDKNEMIELIYKAYTQKESDSKVELLVKELTASITDDERLGICYCIEKAAEAEAKNAFIAGFEAAKELLK